MLFCNLKISWGCMAKDYKVKKVIDIQSEVFSCNQMYVRLSRYGSSADQTTLIANVHSITCNSVCEKFLQIKKKIFKMDRSFSSHAGNTVIYK